MELTEYVFLSVYFSILLVLSVYGAHRYLMAWLFMRHKDRAHAPRARFADLPKVTVQLPIYNEMYVAKRLLEATSRIRYPRHLLEIQVLDDSTDETRSLLEKEVNEYRAAGFNMVYLHRDNRVGFKAGALEAGLQRTNSSFVAVFDADFIPKADFLEQTIHYFTDNQVGMVQVRWDHINRDFSLLTRAQAILLDGHFVIEHTARNRSGRFFNFNGTAGIWRRECIVAAGGWQHDTLTEDLDLSYRAQMVGWNFVYLPETTSMAEVPVEMNSFKTQQHRWAKGSIQTAKKLLPALLRSKLPFKVKLEAVMHLTNNIAYLLMVVLSLMMPMALVIRINHSLYEALLLDFPIFMMATLSVVNFYVLAQREVGIGYWERLKGLPVVMALGIGLAVNNCRAVVEALLNQQTDFVRTPKHQIENKKSTWVGKKYKAGRNWDLWVELGLAAYFLWAIQLAVEHGCWVSIPFLALFLSGFLYVGLMSLGQGFLPDFPTWQFWADKKLSR